MPRIQFSDVTPPERRSIRDIPIPNSGKRKVPIIIKPEKIDTSPIETNLKAEVIEKTTDKTYEQYYPKDKKELDPEINTSSKSKTKTFIFGTMTALLIAIFIVSMMTVFASATIDITPKTEESEVDTKIVGVAGEAGENKVRYEIIKLTETKTVSVPSTGEEAVELKASGKIVVYNNFSTEPQRLIVRTRFESPEGLIFRIPESVVVPGKTIKSGLETPGSIEVEIFADEAGEKYNIKKTDFTIPGFKNDETRYKNFYGRSVTEMSGGFIGKRKVADEAVKQTALQSIQSETEINLKKDLESKIPEGLTLLEGSTIFKSRELPAQEETSSVIIGKEITAYAMMLNKQDLSNVITNEYTAKSANWNNIKPIIKDFALLKISVPLNFESTNTVDLQIEGKVKILADIDTSIISQKLLGSPKKDVAKLMDDFAGISSITAAVRPIWKQSFPTNPSKIYVRTVTDK